MPRIGVTLRVYCGGMRARLSETDRVEVWKGTVQIGTLAGSTLTFLVEHLLLTADMVSWVRGTPTPLGPVTPVPPSLPPAAKRPKRVVPAKPGTFSKQERALKKAQRMMRKKAG